MAEGWWILIVLLALGLILGLAIWTPVQGMLRKARFADARRFFHLQRERLEAKFLDLAAATAKSTAPRWTDCEFENDVSYVRNRSTGELAAFVGVTVSLGTLSDDDEDHDEPPHGGDPFANLRVGTAVFRFDRRRWETDGVVLLNLSPAEAVRFYKDNLEIVAHELAKR